MAHLARIDIFPIKSLPAATRSSSRLLPHGPLEFDRRWKIVDGAWQLINGKRTARVHALRAEFDEHCRRVRLAGDDQPPEWLDLADDRGALEAFLSRHFQQPVRMQEDAEWAFPDDSEAPGPTLVSTATLATVGQWFGLSLDETRARFRANLEIDGVEPFWEDRLFAAEGQAVRFSVGGVALLGVNPCQRCVVPSRDAYSGERIEGFAKRFAQQRAESLPAWAERERFDHFYRLAVNTRRADTTTPANIAVGDAVQVVGLERG